MQYIIKNKLTNIIYIFDIYNATLLKTGQNYLVNNESRG